jgi:PRD1 phage membrane DNA delivery
MTDKLFDSVVTILLAIVGVAILAVLVSKNAQTPQVISAAASGFSKDLGAALSPVTGGSLGITGGLLPGE